MKKLLLWESELFENTYRVYALLCIVGVILYVQTFFFGFTYLDDNVLILDNIPFLSNLGNLFNAFAHDVFFGSSGSTAYYRPLLTISFMPEAMIGGILPFFYHFVNVGIHLIAICLVYVLGTKLHYSKRISLLLSLILLVHPVLTQAVAWLPGRNDSLLAVFVLASFIAFLDFVETKRRDYILWSVCFFLLALFTKETVIVLPVLCIGYLWIQKRLEKNTVLEFSAGWIIAVLIWLPLRITAMTNPLSMLFNDIVSSFLQNLPATLQMLGKVFFPFNLSVLPILQDTTFMWGYIAAALLVLLALFQLKNKQASRQTYFMMFFGLAWFLLFLWPAFVRPDISGTADFIEHRLYLPLIGLLILLAETRLVRILDEPAGEWHLLPWIFVVLAFFCMTFAHENVFKDKLSFWQNAASNSPHSSLAQKNLGAMYYLDKDYPLAEDYSRRALMLNPQETMAHNNLGLIFAARGQVKEAELEYLQELSLNPYYDSAHYNLGLLYYNADNFTGARTEWEETLRINPAYSDAARALYVLNAGGK